MPAQQEYPDPISPRGNAGRRARFSMLTVGYAAMSGSFDHGGFDRGAAELALADIAGVYGSDHELATEFKRFIDIITEASVDSLAVARAGERLVQAVRRSTWPENGGRADLDG